MTMIKLDALRKSDDSEQFVLAVQSFKRRGENLQIDIQKYLIAVSQRWAETGDVRPAVKRINNLLNETPDGIRAHALYAWVEAFLGFVIIEGDRDDAGQFTAGTRKHTELTVSDMEKRENHWYKFTPPTPYKPCNLDDLINAVIKKAATRVKKGVKDVDNIDLDKLAALKGLVAKTPEAAPEADTATPELAPIA
ncbi:hypothetical protein [uncultured Paraglaciecola sp.]|uniref:hypothetical protein n=1 Tax=uncultured Paraglaciecola sp. TaxID=1765024 RepID=UPI002638219D|nr:hypothetical protein [uncultured Paraglaciecola sp.]